MKACRYLGKFDDEATPILFPSPWNCCYRAKKVITPATTHQEEYCLHNFQTCLAYLDSANNNKIPVEEKIVSPRGKFNPRVLIIAAALALLLLVTILVMINQYGFPFREDVNAYLQPPNPSPIPLIAGVTHTPISSPTSITSIPVTGLSLPTLDLAMTSTSIPITKMGLDIPFGTDQKFVIHRLLSGENFINLTEKYLTSIDAIKWVNKNLSVPLQEGSLVIIPINQSSEDPDLPVFEPYEVQVYQVAVEDLARYLDVAPEDLQYYNGIQEGQILPNGYWMIVPRQRD